MSPLLILELILAIYRMAGLSLDQVRMHLVFSSPSTGVGMEPNLTPLPQWPFLLFGSSNGELPMSRYSAPIGRLCGSQCASLHLQQLNICGWTKFLQGDRPEWP